MSYIDGFVAAVPNANRDAYRRHAAAAAAVIKEHGGLRVVECWGEDVPRGKLTDMYLAVKAEPDETVCFSWIEWPSKAARDEGMAKIMADPRLQPDANPDAVRRQADHLRRLRPGARHAGVNPRLAVAMGSPADDRQLDRTLNSRHCGVTAGLTLLSLRARASCGSRSSRIVVPRHNQVPGVDDAVVEPQSSTEKPLRRPSPRPKLRQRDICAPWPATTRTVPVIKLIWTIRRPLPTWPVRSVR